MGTHIGIGFSQDLDAEIAAKKAALQAKTQLSRNKAHFTLLLTTIHYDPQAILPTIREILDESQIIGCSTGGLILSEKIQMRGILLLSISSDEISVGTAYMSDLVEHHETETGINFAKMSLNNFGNQRRDAFLFFVDNQLRTNTFFLRGLQQTLGNMFPLVGGTSCDDFRFTNNFQIYEKNILKNSAVGVLLGGKMGVAVSSRHGWRPLGKPRFIDKASGNIIHAIDGQPAANLYREYFDKSMDEIYTGKLSPLTILYPLGIPIEDKKEYLLRNVIDILPDGSIICQGDVSEGAEVHIMIGNKESCRQAAMEAAQEVHHTLLGKKAKLIIIIESLARLKLLGRMAYQEIAEIKKILGPDVPLIGMYSHGEFCPVQSRNQFKKTYYQNGSIVITAIR